jgi:hypothetical protein
MFVETSSSLFSGDRMESAGEPAPVTTTSTGSDFTLVTVFSGRPGSVRVRGFTDQKAPQAHAKEEAQEDAAKDAPPAS